MVTEPLPVSPSAAVATPRRHSRRFVTVTLVGLTLVITGHAILGERGLLTLLDVRQEVQAAQTAIRTLRYENALLRARAAELRRDGRIVEEVARRELGLIQEGELLFIISESSSPAPSAGTEDSEMDVDPDDR